MFLHYHTGVFECVQIDMCCESRGTKPTADVCVCVEEFPPHRFSEGQNCPQVGRRRPHSCSGIPCKFLVESTRAVPGWHLDMSHALTRK